MLLFNLWKTGFLLFLTIPRQQDFIIIKVQIRRATSGICSLPTRKKQLASFYKAKVLEDVVVKAKTKKPVDVLDEKYTSGLFSGGDAYQFDLLNDPSAVGAISIFNYLQGSVPGLQITTGITHFIAMARRYTTNLSR